MACNKTPEEKEKMKQQLKEFFNQCDKNKDGTIEPKEMENILTMFNSSGQCQKKMTPAEIKELSGEFVKACDKNHDGKVSFEEFYKFICEAGKKCGH